MSFSVQLLNDMRDGAQAMTNTSDIERFRENWQDEVDSASEYRALAAVERDPKIAEVYSNLARMEETHIGFWEDRLRAAETPLYQRQPSWRSRILMWVARRLGPEVVLSTIAAKEAAARNGYSGQAETRRTPMSAQERWHALVLGKLVETQPRGLSGNIISRLEGRHRAVGGNALRAAVLGANDGLCSNLSLVMGVAGASISPHAILMTGIAGLLAGACSMALGEWVSVTSSRELAEREIRIESSELGADPVGEGEELQLIYEARGLDSKESKRVVAEILKDKAAALDTLAREELGIDPTELGGAPGEAALASFLLFSAGATIPILPFLLPGYGIALLGSLLLSSVALFAIGAAITIFTGASVWHSGGRQLLLGLAAAGVTFTIGHLIGVVLS
jgi:VIT1/CCC1 family predicted Fe2+/Mn2+ transporter